MRWAWLISGRPRGCQFKTQAPELVENACGVTWMDLEGSRSRVNMVNLDSRFLVVCSSIKGTGIILWKCAPLHRRKRVCGILAGGLTANGRLC